MRRREFITLLGGAAATPFSACAQTSMPLIGFLGVSSPGLAAPFTAAFRQGLNDFGYTEGQNVVIEYRWAEGRYDRLPALASDLARLKVNAIVTTGGALGAQAAKHATSTIPIVFFTGGAPVTDGLVTSLARPGGNVTGVTILSGELTPKRLELIHEVVPKAKVIALLINQNFRFQNVERMLNNVQAGARAKGVQLHILEASNEVEIDAAFTPLVQLRAEALVVASDPFFVYRREQLVALASRHAIPAIYDSREFTEAGGLISYGTSYSAAFRQVGIYTGRILKGAKPGDLPVQQPTKFELVFNLSTARAIGLTISREMLLRADEVIE